MSSLEIDPMTRVFENSRPPPVRIIALAPNDWDGLWMNRQQLLSRLARRHDVLYTNGPWTSWDRFSEAYRRSPLLSRFVMRGAVVVDEPGRLIMRIPRFPVIDRLAIKTVTRRWRRRVSPHPERPLVAFVSHPQLEPLVADLGADFLVYHAFDLFRLSPDWSKDLEAKETRLLADADLVLASSQQIARDLTLRSGRPVELVGNGVDYELYANANKDPEPDDIARIPHPRIGYVGNISRKFDFDLILQLAERRPSWQFVLVGPVYTLPPADAQKLERCRERANVHLLGVRSVDVVARYTAALDVGLICYRTDGLWTQAAYPLKMHEYLACGLPVVSIDLPAVREFAAVIRICRDAHDWEPAIASALEDVAPGDTIRRQQIASSNSWDSRVETLERHLAEMLAGRVAN